MSRGVLTPLAATEAPGTPIFWALVPQEAGRLLRHPVSLLGFGVLGLIVVLSMVVDDGPRAAFDTVTISLAFYPGMLLILAADLVASRDRRAGSDELLAALPAPSEDRVRAVLLAALAPAAVGLLVVLGLQVLFLVTDRYVVTPGPFHLLQGPVTLLGACALGVMVAVWFPYRGASVVALVAMVAVDVWLQRFQHGELLGTATPWAQWGTYPDSWAGLVQGSVGWHLLYLLGLTGMAATAALVRVSHRRGPVVVAGLAAVALTVTSGIAQLP